MHKGEGSMHVVDKIQRQALDDLKARVLRGGNDPHGPVRESLARLGDRWTPLLLLVLHTGTLRFTELQRQVNDMAEGSLSQRILTLKLRALERDGMLERRVIATIPPQVEYSLKPLGVSLVTQFEALLVWLEQQAPVIEAARQAYDA
ncbi:winged helix-turn-helix transcriptional regulator [Pseudomonas marginalis]|jgi:DNA-binding HxlR family transcriptional regulator|uniref:HxlR family transcriptional regulator n=1 Tax=Pseudomonas poae TaxID=200451 RepID=A0A7Z1K5M0_9PSED|nr:MULTISPECIES: helix-turn-helix domain-containing protein [Pseudomonas]KAA8554257.1 putative HTH-type transcriptional regulator YybR [Pseudomonas marginalis]MCP1463605.1 DNA-binding HxlR family transcriptional regulator [Pseudomonas sp. S3E17]NMZ93918.1 helix-turn-helix transcriptional regulator [Pseudomonas marginalis]OCW19016.1 HxlR family transcriptional regulator [Pseudomonas sp. S3E12]PFG71396.1 HxlR family transcriptional regulator [Pseudomonas poae]